MTWSFGLLVLLVCLVILLACFAVKLLFKRGTRLRVVRAVHREEHGEGRAKGHGDVVTVRAPVTTPDEAQRSADATGLPRALMRAGGPLPAVVVALGVAGWLCWRVLVSRHHVLDAWIVWTRCPLRDRGRAARGGRLRGARHRPRRGASGRRARAALQRGSRRRGADALRPAAPELAAGRDPRRRRRLHPGRLCGRAGLVHPAGGAGRHLRQLAAHPQ